MMCDFIYPSLAGNGFRHFRKKAADRQVRLRRENLFDVAQSSFFVD